MILLPLEKFDRAMQLQYDSEIDTPATIAIIGGGPAGIEAAAYARFLGYSVELYDAQKVGDSLVQWGDRPMDGNWRQLTSSLGLAAIEAHDHPLPELDLVPTYSQYVEQYLLPLARTDLMYSSITINSTVISVGRLGCPPDESIDLERRAEQEFRVLIESEQRGQFTQVVDLVFDCSGAESVRSGLASGGGEPINWSRFGSRVHRGRRRVLTRERELLSGKKILLWGDDAAAAANALDLLQLVQNAGTQLFWCLPKRIGGNQNRFDESVMEPLLSQEIDEAKSLYAQADGLHVVPLEAWGIEALREDAGKLLVTLQKTEDDTVDFAVDEIINCGSLIADRNYRHTLQIDSLNGSTFATCEPHFYRFGIGRSQPLINQPISNQSSNSHWMQTIREQVRGAFGLIGGRTELDLYQSVRPRK